MIDKAVSTLENVLFENTDLLLEDTTKVIEALKQKLMEGKGWHTD